MVEEEIELDLGLSIGGSFGKPEKLKPVKKVYALTADAESNGFDVYGKENRPGVARDGEHVDLLAKREMHALRRQEAKRKREEKQEIKRGTCKANNGAYWSEWGMEEEPPARKREMTDEQMQKQRQHNGDVANAVPFPAAVQQYPYAPVQYVPFTNGGFPCVMPCWVPGGGAFEPSTWRGFKPYQGNQSLGFNLYNGCEKGEKDGVNGETTSYGSPICGSSAGSEDHSSSHEGGGSSSDSRSRSCPSLVRPQLNGHKANDHTKGHSENSASSEPVESDHGNKVRQSEEENTEAKPSDSTPGPAKETKIDMGKPPKPQTQNQSSPPPPPLHRMPYVSTTGNGPNGKTITGFLYRYSKSEVSIVCVCHGSTFSPAEFVQHAGGTDVSHPLRNITVIPSAFG